LQQKVTADGPDGHPEASYSDVATVGAKIWPLRGDERSSAAGVHAIGTHDITIHYRSDVQPEWRFVLGTRIFDIEYPINLGEQNRWLVCRCTEVL